MMANNKNILNNGEESQDRDIANQKKTCFIITPIGDNNSEIRRHIDGIIDQSITPAIGDKYKIIVAHREYEIGSINDRIIRSIYEADLVIANLTNTNPNVMYELAIRHSFGKPAIVIAEEDTKLPFDVVVENTIFYRNDPTGANELKQQLIEYEKSINPEKKDYGPVYKVVDRIPLYNEVESGKNVSTDKVLQYIIDRLDSLERNINLKMQDTSKEFSNYFIRGKIMITFKKEDKSFTRNEVYEILSIFRIYDAKNLKYDNAENNLEVSCNISEKSLEELKNHLDKRLLIRNITYDVLYAAI